MLCCEKCVLCVCVFVCVCMCVCVCVCVCVCTLRYASSQNKHRYSDGVNEDLRKKYNHRLSLKFKKTPNRAPCSDK
jgi:hypothetical protein